jgi:hypothetical protein
MKCNPVRTNSSFFAWFNLVQSFARHRYPAVINFQFVIKMSSVLTSNLRPRKYVNVVIISSATIAVCLSLISRDKITMVTTEPLICNSPSKPRLPVEWVHSFQQIISYSLLQPLMSSLAKEDRKLKRNHYGTWMWTRHTLDEVHVGETVYWEEGEHNTGQEGKLLNGLMRVLTWKAVNTEQKASSPPFLSPFQPPSFLIVPWVLQKVQSQSK